MGYPPGPLRRRSGTGECRSRRPASRTRGRLGRGIPAPHHRAPPGYRPMWKPISRGTLGDQLSRGGPGPPPFCSRRLPSGPMGVADHGPRPATGTARAALWSGRMPVRGSPARNTPSCHIECPGSEAAAADHLGRPDPVSGVSRTQRIPFPTAAADRVRQVGRRSVDRSGPGVLEWSGVRRDREVLEGVPPTSVSTTSASSSAQPSPAGGGSDPAPAPPKGDAAVGCRPGDRSRARQSLIASPPVQPVSSITSRNQSVITMWLEATVVLWGGSGEPGVPGQRGAHREDDLLRDRTLPLAVFASTGPTGRHRPRGPPDSSRGGRHRHRPEPAWRSRKRAGRAGRSPPRRT